METWKLVAATTGGLGAFLTVIVHLWSGPRRDRLVRQIKARAEDSPGGLR